MFGGDEFTLDKFKAMIDNDSDLSQFRRILLGQKDKIFLKNDEIERKKFEKINIVEENLEKSFAVPEQKSLLDEKDEECPLTYLPTTFEGMMENFGINLQRKNLYNEFYGSISDMEKGIKQKDSNEKYVGEKAELASSSM